ncbi:hypothetical protein Q7P35_009509 [Cladosporium inversicolor]
MPDSKTQLHWTQRVALIRSSLHSASRSGDFTFFKSLQAAGMIEGTNHVAVLSAEMGDDVDLILAAMDNLNAGLTYVHQDAFQKVYEGLKSSMKEEGDGETSPESKRARLYVDMTMQRNIADLAIDKMTNSAVALINNQSETFQESAANVWITGATIIADCIEITLKEMQSLDTKMTDFIRVEESWNAVKASIVSAVTGLKGVFWLMDTSYPSSSADMKPLAAPRSASIASAGAGMFRRLSTAFASGTPSAPSPATSRSSSIASQAALNLQAHRANSVASANGGANGSISGSMSGSTDVNKPVYKTPNYVRHSISTGCPTSMPANFEAFRRNLSTIPPTPAQDDDKDPFDTSEAPPVPALPDMVHVPNEPMVQQSLVESI